MHVMCASHASFDFDCPSARQELGEASTKNQSPAGPGPAGLAPIQVPQPETPQGLPQEPPMTSELQAAFQAQAQFLMQAQQLAALQTALNASRLGQSLITVGQNCYFPHPS